MEAARYSSTLGNNFAESAAVAEVCPLPSVILVKINFFAVVHVQLNGKTDSGHGEEKVFAVDAEWFRVWEQFVRGDCEGNYPHMLER